MPFGRVPTFRSLETGVFLGYRRGRLERRWLARLYDETEKRYAITAIGYADDPEGDALPGQPKMSYAQARDAVLVLAARRRAKVAAGSSVLTVRKAIEDYIVVRDKRETARQGRSVKSDAHRLRKHVLCDSELAELPLGDLTEKRLAEWRGGLGGAVASRRRTTNDFRAALFAAKPDATARLAITEGLKTPDEEAGEQAPRDNQILTDEEVRSLIVAARAADDDGDLHRMVLLLAATGARFSQVRRLLVRDVQASRLMMPASRKGRKRASEKPSIPVPLGSDVIAALQTVIRGRKGNEALLERWRHRQTGYDPTTGRVRWEREGRGPWSSASELSRHFTTIAAAAKLPGTIPYALRHSSIVRALRQGLPIRLVAALHDTSVTMVERHYARWITE